ncbi:MAG: hypothetical protein NTX24_01615 [Candidatus Pacearchaeota archaeon]|nr:hypothetical protein [Candidatus Pacearchaeota archaeon]
MPEKKKYVKICPNCGSLDILASNYSPSAVAFGVPVPYRCRRCGFTSPIFPEVDVKEVEKLNKDQEREKENRGEEEEEKKND